MAQAITTDNIEAAITPIITKVVGEVVGPLVNEIMVLIDERFDKLEVRLSDLEAKNSLQDIVLSNHELRVNKLEQTA